MKQILRGVLAVALLSAAVFFLSKNSDAYMDTSYYQAGVNEYYCASTTTAPSASPAGLNALNPPLILQNPVNSGVKLVLRDEGVVFTSSVSQPTAVLLAYNVTPSSPVISFTTGTWTGAIIGISTSGVTTASKANCYVAGSLPAAPTAFRVIGGASGANGASVYSLIDHSFPEVVLYPGGIVSVQTTAAANLMAHISWVELPY